MSTSFAKPTPAASIHSKRSKNINSLLSASTLTLHPMSQGISKSLILANGERMRIGRPSSKEDNEKSDNGVYSSKVLSRSHAEVWSNDGKVFIRDIGSSNGTWVNGTRLSPEGQQSQDVELKQGDEIWFGLDIFNEDGSVLYGRVKVKVGIQESRGFEQELAIKSVPVAANNSENSSFDSINYETVRTFDQPKNVMKVFEKPKNGSLFGAKEVKETKSVVSVDTRVMEEKMNAQEKQIKELAEAVKAEREQSMDVKNEVLLLKREIEQKKADGMSAVHFVSACVLFFIFIQFL